MLARQDRASESNAIFLKMLGAKAPGGGAQVRFFLNQPQLRYEIARALEYNQANLRTPLPPELEALRHPPRPQPLPGERP